MIMTTAINAIDEILAGGWNMVEFGIPENIPARFDGLCDRIEEANYQARKNRAAL